MSSICFCTANACFCLDCKFLIDEGHSTGMNGLYNQYGISLEDKREGPRGAE
jgi:hypothetical protein